MRSKPIVVFEWTHLMRIVKEWIGEIGLAAVRNVAVLPDALCKVTVVSLVFLVVW